MSSTEIAGPAVVPFTRGLLPGTSPALWVDVCGVCGAMVMHRETHADWHRAASSGTP